MDPSELIVGFLDAERASQSTWDATDFNDKLAIFYRDRVPGGTPPAVTDDDLVRIRERRSDLFAQWEAIAPGATLELTFVVPVRHPVP